MKATERYVHKVYCTWWFQFLSYCMNSYGVTIHIQPLQKYFHVIELGFSL